MTNPHPIPRKPVAVEVYEAKAKWIDGCLVYKRQVARRLYERRHGKLPPGILVCHTCDNPFCILDAHHFPGTQSDNIKDSVQKGRHACLRTQSAEEKTKRSKTILKRLEDPILKAAWQASVNQPAQRRAVSKAAKKLWADFDRRAAMMEARNTPDNLKAMSDRAKKQKKVRGKFA
jgi:hypothetical protein